MNDKQKKETTPVQPLLDLADKIDNRFGYLKVGHVATSDEVRTIARDMQRIHETNLFLMANAEARKRTIVLQETKLQQGTMDKIDAIIDATMQKKLEQYEQVRLMAHAYLIQNIAEKLNVHTVDLDNPCFTVHLQSFGADLLEALQPFEDVKPLDCRGCLHLDLSCLPHVRCKEYKRELERIDGDLEMGYRCRSCINEDRFEASE